MDKFFVLLLSFAIFCVVGLFFLAVSEHKKFNDLVTDCMNDGHKRYECLSILRRCR